MNIYIVEYYHYLEHGEKRYETNYVIASDINNAISKIPREINAVITKAELRGVSVEGRDYLFSLV